MNNRIKEIDSYLIFLRDVYMQNPDFPITSKGIYGSLCNYGINDKSDLSLKQFHSEWIQYFENVDNINVFVSPSWRYFCQFKNVKNQKQQINPIKLYLSVNKQHINQAAKEIFKFLADNDIEHLSKIGSKVRSDDIVIRLQNIEDLPSVKNFVKNCSAVSKGKLKTNPFLYRDNVFAYALDDYLSYNTVLSLYLSDYFNLRRDGNQLASVSYSDFYKFLHKKYHSVFIDGKDLTKYMNDYNFYEKHHPKGFSALFLNYYQITYLLLTSLNPNYSLEKLTDLYYQFNDDNVIYQQIEAVKKFLSNDKKDKVPTVTVEKIPVLNTLEYMVKKCVAVMSKKYGVNQTKKNIFKYINNNDLNYITREGGLRGIFKNNLSPEKVSEILSVLVDNSGFEEFAENVLTEFDVKVILRNASFITLKKYQELSNSGISQLYYALNLGLGGDYSGFTNQDLAREKLKDNLLPSEFKKTVISSLGLNENMNYDSSYLVEQYVNYISKIYSYSLSRTGGNSI